MRQREDAFEHFLRAGLWKQWRYDLFAGAEVHGSTLGILGMGRIGQGIAKRGAHGFGMKVIYHNRSRLAPELEAEPDQRDLGNWLHAVLKVFHEERGDQRPGREADAQRLDQIGEQTAAAMQKARSM